MKKVYLLLLSVLFLFNGCEINKFGTKMFTDYIKAYHDNWTWEGRPGEAGFCAWQKFEFKEITKKVMDEGAVMVYFIDKEGRDNALPYVFTVDNGRMKLMENIRFRVEKGFLTIVVEWSDAEEYAFTPADDMRFKVCILSEED